MPWGLLVFAGRAGRQASAWDGVSQVGGRSALACVHHEISRVRKFGGRDERVVSSRLPGIYRAWSGGVVVVPYFILGVQDPVGLRVINGGIPFFCCIPVEFYPIAQRNGLLHPIKLARLRISIAPHFNPFYKIRIGVTSVTA